MKKHIIIGMLSLVFIRGYVSDVCYVKDLNGTEIMMFQFEDRITGEQHKVICRDSNLIFFIQQQAGQLLRLSVRQIDKRTLICVRASRI